MRLNGEYSWLKQYVDLPNFWVEDVLSWDESFNLALADSSFFTFATSTNLAKTYVYLDSFTKSSFLDILLLNSSTENTEPAELYEALLWDLYEFTYASAYASKFMWYTDSQTFCSVALRHSPELVSAVNDFFVAYTNPFLLSYATTAASYVFSDYSSSLIQRALNLAALICLAAWLGTFFFFNTATPFLAPCIRSLLNEAYALLSIPIKRKPYSSRVPPLDHPSLYHLIRIKPYHV